MPTTPSTSSTSSDATPTIVLVHGAFAESASWDPVIDRLLPRGLDVVAVANPLRSLASDAAYVRDVLDAIGGPIVLVGHSYAGMVITEAAADHPAVVGLVYVGAFTPDTGESAFELSTRFPGSSLADALVAHPVTTGGVELTIERSRFHGQFAADVPAEIAARMAVTQRAVTQAALTDTLSTGNPPWKHLPSWYVFGELDLNIPAQLVRFQADRAQGRERREIEGASHAISVSAPEAVAATIVDAAAACSLEPAS